MHVFSTSIRSIFSSLLLCFLLHPLLQYGTIGFYLHTSLSTFAKRFSLELTRANIVNMYMYTMHIKYSSVLHCCMCHFRMRMINAEFMNTAAAAATTPASECDTKSLYELKMFV